MSRHAMPVADRATDLIRGHGARSRSAMRRRRVQSHTEFVRPPELWLGPLFPHTHDAVVVGDVRTGSVVQWNPAAEQLFGWAAREAIGQSVDSLISPAILPLYRAGIALYDDDDPPRPFRLPVTRADGAEVGVEFCLLPLDSPPERYFMVLGREVNTVPEAPSPTSSLGQPVAPASPGVHLQFQRLNLVPLVARVVARARSRGTPHKVNMALPQGLTATVDPERIEHVLDLLIEKVFERSPGGCWIDVDLRRPLTGQARIEVRDFGRPLDDATRRRLAEGVDVEADLALARTVVEQHGGSLRFELPEDGGVRAVVMLPTQRGRRSAMPLQG
jgi:PAS domain S-box-containing protein